jgi:putative Mg2+ transporter-C (MgtC) family protein
MFYYNAFDQVYKLAPIRPHISFGLLSQSRPHDILILAVSFFRRRGTASEVGGFDLSSLEIIIRIAAAISVGTIIGIERERKNRPAGMRTHVLVSLGACIIALIECAIQAQELARSVDGNVTFTLGRITAQVVSGIGFLGAGTIVMARKKIVGLTTAASLWNTACLGIAAGMGYYEIAGYGCALVLIVLMVMPRIININVSKHLEIRFVHRAETIPFINNYFREKNIEVFDVDFRVENRETGNLYTNTYDLKLPRSVEYIEVVQYLSEYPNVQGVRTINA